MEYGKFVVGWIVVVGIGGVLLWCLYIWLIGFSGLGKLMVMDKIIKVCLCGVVVIFDGGMFEVGVCKYFGLFSRLFIMDEVESESLCDRVEMDKIVGLFCKVLLGGVIVNVNVMFNV